MIEGLQQTNISLNKGIVRTPSLGAEGELSECVNLIPHAGEMVRIKEPQSMGLELLDDEILLATNRCDGKENLIVRKGTALKYYRKTDGKWFEHMIATLTEEEAEVITIGQTLVVSQGVSRRYFLWEEEGYKEQNPLNCFPKVELRLGNKGFTPVFDQKIDPLADAPFRTFTWKVGESELLIEDNYSVSPAVHNLYWFPKGSNAGVLNSSFWARYNEIREKFRSAQSHCFPFYVRWGIELYDGSIVNISAPILLMPSSVLRPYVGWLRKEYSNIPVNTKTDGKGQEWNIGFTPRNLYITIDASGLENTNADIIKGIVVYASPEIEVVDTDYEIFSDGKYRIFEYKEENTTDGLGWDMSFIDANRWGGGGETTVSPAYFNYLTYLPCKKDVRSQVEAFNDPVEFYELASIPWEVVKEKNYKVVASLQEGKLPPNEDGSDDIEASTDSAYTAITNQGFLPYKIMTRLDALTSQRQLSESMLSQESQVVANANSAYSYNSRIFYGGVNLKIPHTISASQVLANNKLPGSGASGSDLSLSVKIGEKYLTIEGGGALAGYEGESAVLAFPHKDATGIAIYNQIGSWGAKVLFQRSKSYLGGYSLWSGITEELIKGHPDIKGAFLSASEIGEEWKSNSYLESSEVKGNTVAVTKVANPWVIEAVYELACGEIYALTSATEALSEGQFGEFPIYAFTDNGIYALSIDRDGTIEAKQPISRDVLLEMNNTLQIDKAVIYPTKEGLKLITGRNTSLLSASIAGLNVQENDFNSPSELTIADAAPFQEQLEGIKMVYDYAHRQVHLFGREVTSEGKQKHYVYDLESGQWATQILDEQLTTCVAGYPFSTMQFGKQLMQYTDELEADVVKQGWLLTRPISFSDPFTRKMLADIRVLGQKTNTDTKFKVQVYISEDRVKWHRLTSLKGRSAKWYRFLIMADMCGLDTLTGITCQYVARLGGKLR